MHNAYVSISATKHPVNAGTSISFWRFFVSKI